MPEAKSLLGSVLNGYFLFGELATNASRTVYSGRKVAGAHPQSECVVSFFHSVRLTTLQKQVQFLREAHLRQSLHHPHILPLLFYGIEAESPYLAVESGPHLLRSLQKRLQRREFQPFEQEEALAIIRQSGEALHYAHQRGMLHGKLSPHAILFSSGERVVVSDFLFASLKCEVGPADFSEYHAPEQLHGVLDARSDLFSLGCLAYTLLTGYRPLRASRLSEASTRVQIAPRAHNPALPTYIEKALLRALEEQPELRYETILDFLHALRLEPVARTLSEDEEASPRENPESAYAPSLPVSVPPLALTFTLPEHGLSASPFAIAKTAEMQRTEEFLKAAGEPQPAIEERRLSIATPPSPSSRANAQKERTQKPSDASPPVPGSPAPRITLRLPALAVPQEIVRSNTPPRGSAPPSALPAPSGSTWQNQLWQARPTPLPPPFSARAYLEKETPLPLSSAPRTSREKETPPPALPDIPRLRTKLRLSFGITSSLALLVTLIGACFAFPFTSRNGQGRPQLVAQSFTATATSLPLPGGKPAIDPPQTWTKATPTLSPTPSLGPSLGARPGQPTATSGARSGGGSTPTPSVATGTNFAYSFDDGSADGWDSLNSTVQVSSTMAWNGAYSLQVRFETPTTMNNPYVYVTGSNPSTLAPGQTISIYIYVPGNLSGVSADISLQTQHSTWYDSPRRSLSAGGWHHLTSTVPPLDAPVSTLGIDLYCSSSSGTATLYIDAVSVS